MSETEIAMSASELDRRAGLLPAERRTLVNAGILNPRRTAAGWAVFGEDDLVAATAWRTVNPKRSRGRHVRA